jgi:hypothetical protein
MAEATAVATPGPTKAIAKTVHIPSATDVDGSWTDSQNSRSKSETRG